MKDSEFRKLIAELYEIDPREEQTINDFIIRQGTINKKLFYDLAASFRELKKQRDSGEILSDEFERLKRSILNLHDEKVNKNIATTVYRFMGIIFGSALIVIGCLWLAGMLNFKDTRVKEFVICENARLLRIEETFSYRDRDNLEVEVERFDRSQLKNARDVFDVRWVRLMPFNESAENPIVTIVAIGERISRGRSLYKGISLPLRNKTIQLVAELTFKDRARQNEWLGENMSKFFYIKFKANN